MFDNILLNTDSYKASHAFQYPPNTTRVFSYIESRGGRFDRTVFFGLQGFLKQYLSKPVTAEQVDEAAEFWAAHGEPFYREGWDYIVREHAGILPVIIRAVPEGTVVPTHNVLVTVENTDPKCFWLTSFLETAILRSVWYPTTVATVSWHVRQSIFTALVKSSEAPLPQINWKCQDFGARGCSSMETAAIGGAAHLVNFSGSDTVSGILYARRFYGAPMAGFSIPAAEHSTITAWGRDGETAAYANMLEQFAKPGALVAVVSDSYDLMHAVREIWGGELRERIVNSGATLVVRPDSGDPLTVPVDVVEALGERFGFTTNSLGYRVLPDCVRVIQGDGINVDSLPQILDNLLERGWSADNMAFGMGGGLLQQVNRDTQKFAMKASACEVDGVWRDVFKDPLTDPGKRSKRGKVTLWTSGDEFETAVSQPKRWTDRGITWTEALDTVWRNGELLVDQTFDEIRARANPA